MTYKYLKPHEIKQPKGALIVDRKAHMLGSVTNLKQAVIDFYGSETLVPNSDGRPFCSHFNVQRLVDGEDPYDCVICAHQNAIYGNLKAKSGVDLDEVSRKATAVDSGTQPGVGNSNWNVEQSIERGMYSEVDCPSNLANLALFYSKLDKVVYTKESFKKFYDIKFIPLPLVDGFKGTTSPADVAYAMSISPFLVVSVNGQYDYNNDEQVVRVDESDSHDVLLVHQPTQNENFNTVVDSENSNGFVAFEPKYEFHDHVLVLVKKKYQPMLFKLNGQPAIYFKHWSQDLLIPFGDGIIPGGDLFKSLYGVSSYDQLPIKHVDVLPFPVATYAETTK